ncbi:hydroxyacid dehydrogenase [Candidatus Bathyarchaeota archaeon]|nr:hydroxyacid dehydrogenase [Candidatus Bathyarchaeota archaeon]
MDHNEIPKRSVILCADHFYLSGDASRRLNEAGEVVWSKTDTEEMLVRDAEDATVIIAEYARITSRIIDAASKLKAVAVWGVGYDHVDVEAASNRGVYVTNCRGANAESVAEHVFALILALSRKVIQMDGLVRGARWSVQQETGLGETLIPEDLQGKTIGVIGFGEIGSRVSRIAHGFDMRVLVNDPYVSPERVRDHGAEQVDFESLLRNADIVTIHTVLTPETRGLISRRQLAAMKPSAILINASRGAIVDQNDLAEALKEKTIASAGLDVFDREPIDPYDALLELENVVLSPHIAGGSMQALNATSMNVAMEVSLVLRGKVPRNLVNRDQLQKRGFI